MTMNPHRSRVYRRCACRDRAGKQLGARCPRLTSTNKHGTWSFAVDLPSLTGRRTTMRRSGFTTKADANTALHHVLECERTGIQLDDRQTVATYLADWLATKALTLKPTTLARYTDYITRDLIPALGAVRLEQLSHRHISQFARQQLDAGRGLITLRRCIATLSSALTDAIRQRRLSHNPARYITVPRPPRYERLCWTPSQAVTFLRHCANVCDPLAELYEVIMGTGMRKGEALHWSDVLLDERILFIRYTLSNINNTTPVFTTPKTRSSRAWIGLSDRVIEAFQRQAERQRLQRLAAGTSYHDENLVFTRAHGNPLRPEYVLRHLHQLTDEADLPRIRVHDLRHFAATTMLSSQVPLAMASKTMQIPRHDPLPSATAR